MTPLLLLALLVMEFFFNRWAKRNEDMRKVVEYFDYTKNIVAKQALIAELEKVSKL